MEALFYWPNLSEEQIGANKRKLKASASGKLRSDMAGSEQVLPLELNEDDDSFLIAENPSFRFSLLLIREDTVAFLEKRGSG